MCWFIIPPFSEWHACLSIIIMQFSQCYWPMDIKSCMHTKIFRSHHRSFVPIVSESKQLFKMSHSLHTWQIYCNHHCIDHACMCSDIITCLHTFWLDSDKPQLLWEFEQILLNRREINKRRKYHKHLSIFTSESTGCVWLLSCGIY